MKKILLIGSKGMAGHILYHYIKENTAFELIDIARGTASHVPSYEMDVTDFDGLEKVIRAERPEIVVNCIGVLNQDAEQHPEKAILLNSYLPHFLAQKGNELNYKLIHISTDCVFNGKKGGYTELSEKDGIGFYASTKALGEVTYGNHLTLRTSIVGPEIKATGIGLFNWFMKQQGEINGYTQAYWTGVTTIELAKAIVEAIKQDISGLHHLVNEQKISKYELVGLFKQVFEIQTVEILPYADYHVDKSLVRTNFAFNYKVPSYLDMVAEMRQWVIQHKDLYQYLSN